MTPTKRWIIATPDPALVAMLSRELALPGPLAQVLVNRGYRDTEAAAQFLGPQLRRLEDPFALPDMAAAVDRILVAIERHERIVIYGDYDVDGVTSSALLWRVLRAAGGDAEVFLPHRVEEGYGLSPDGVARCVQERRPELLVAVDCGTSSAEEIARLRQQGVDTVVLDHHEPSAELPECAALVNPKRTDRTDRTDPTDPLAAVGVTFKLAHALQKRARERKLAWGQELDLREHLDLVALGTVADIVPLTGENRILVKAGLERLARTGKAGLRALLDVAGVRGAVSPYHVGFRLGPRLNAAGRLGDAQLALELLLTVDAARARELAETLDGHNAERQRIEERIVQEALAQARTERELAVERVLALSQEGWHVGVIGIVASRVVQEFYRPTVVIGLERGAGKGSCRSVAGFSMVAALEHCAAWLERFGGHEMAAGLSVTESNIPGLRRALNEYAAGVLAEEDLLPRVSVDAVVRLEELDAEFFQRLGQFEPCGAGNPTPVFTVRGVSVRGAPRVVGRKHLKFAVTDGETTVEAIWWGMAGRQLPGGPIEVACSPGLNEYRGAETVQLVVKDVRPAAGPSAG